MIMAYNGLLHGLLHMAYCMAYCTGRQEAGHLGGGGAHGLSKVCVCVSEFVMTL